MYIFYFVFHAAVYFSSISHDGFYVNYCDGGVLPWSPWYISVSWCCSPDTTNSTNTTALYLIHYHHPPLLTAHCSPQNCQHRNTTNNFLEFFRKKFILSPFRLKLANSNHQFQLSDRITFSRI